MKKKSYRAQEAGIAQRYYTMRGAVRMNYTATKDFPTRLAGLSRASLFPVAGWHHAERPRGTEGLHPALQGQQALQVAEMAGVASAADFSVSQGSATFFGTALESDGGVIIDNFSLRGASGQTLADLPEATLREFDKLRPYDLIIVQYGVNAVTEGSTTPPAQGLYGADADGGGPPQAQFPRDEYPRGGRPPTEAPRRLPTARCRPSRCSPVSRNRWPATQRWDFSPSSAPWVAGHDEAHRR